MKSCDCAQAVAAASQATVENVSPGAILTRGESLGRYVILELVGSGGMGVVYAAYDPDLERKVALKLLRPGWPGNTGHERRRRLLREAQAMARLHHPNVVSAFDVGTIGEQVFVAMEFVAGVTLRE
jgi:serine/threonine protein kinase